MASWPRVARERPFLPIVTVVMASFAVLAVALLRPSRQGFGGRSSPRVLRSARPASQGERKARQLRCRSLHVCGLERSDTRQGPRSGTHRHTAAAREGRLARWPNSKDVIARVGWTTSSAPPRSPALRRARLEPHLEAEGPRVHAPSARRARRDPSPSGMRGQARRHPARRRSATTARSAGRRRPSRPPPAEVPWYVPAAGLVPPPPSLDHVARFAQRVTQCSRRTGRQGHTSGPYRRVCRHRTARVAQVKQAGRGRAPARRLTIPDPPPVTAGEEIEYRGRAGRYARSRSVDDSGTSRRCGASRGRPRSGRGGGRRLFAAARRSRSRNAT